MCIFAMNQNSEGAKNYVGLNLHGASNNHPIRDVTFAFVQCVNRALAIGLINRTILQIPVTYTTIPDTCRNIKQFVGA